MDLNTKQRISVARSVATAALKRRGIDGFAVAAVLRDVAQLAEELAEKQDKLQEEANRLSKLNAQFINEAVMSDLQLSIARNEIADLKCEFAVESLDLTIKLRDAEVVASVDEICRTDVSL